MQLPLISRLTTETGSSVFTSGEKIPSHILRFEEFLKEEFKICPPGMLAARTGGLIFVDMDADVQELIQMRFRGGIYHLMTNTDSQNILIAAHNGTAKDEGAIIKNHTTVARAARDYLASRRIPGVTPVTRNTQTGRSISIRTEFTRPNMGGLQDDLFTFAVAPNYEGTPNCRRYAPHLGIVLTWISETKAVPKRQIEVIRKEAENAGDTNYSSNPVAPLP